MTCQFNVRVFSKEKHVTPQQQLKTKLFYMFPYLLQIPANLVFIQLCLIFKRKES